MSWTEEEEQWLKENYRFSSRKTMIDKLDRRWQAISQKAKRMELKRDKKRKVVDSLPLNETDKAYLAGILDCDGHIGIYQRGLSDNYAPNFLLSMTLPDTVYWAADKLGLNVRLNQISKRNPDHKDQYVIQTSRSDIIRTMLIYVLPYLQSKRKQAKILLEFIQDCKYNGKQSSSLAEEYKKKIYS